MAELALPGQQHPTGPYPHFTEWDSCFGGIIRLEERLNNFGVSEITTIEWN